MIETVNRNFLEIKSEDALIETGPPKINYSIKSTTDESFNNYMMAFKFNIFILKP